MEGKPITMVIKSLNIKRNNKTSVFSLTYSEWNYWLNRYYPSAKLILEVIHL